MLRRATCNVGKSVNELLAGKFVPTQSQLANMSDRKGDKGYMESAADKTMEMAHNAKETVIDAAQSAKETVKDVYNKVAGNETCETAAKDQNTADTRANLRPQAEDTNKTMTHELKKEGQKHQERH